MKKLVYWNLKERWMVKNADVIRAVSKLEQKNLETNLHRKVVLIENGVVVPSPLPKPSPVTVYLLLAGYTTRRALSRWSKHGMLSIVRTIRLS
ncbi:MAG: hypothetical protein WDO15_10415 [Bacteroidota bacterium]